MIARRVMCIAILVAASAATSTAAAQAAQAGAPADGKAAYDANCKKCHGVRGTPPKTMKAKFPKIATFDAEFIAKRSDDSVVKVLANGKSDDMKSFKGKLTAAEMALVAAYVRELALKSNP